MSTSEYMTIEEVARHFRVSVSTVRAWVRRGTIPALMVANIFRFKLPEVEAALLAHSKLRPTKTAPPVLDPVGIDPNQDM